MRLLRTANSPITVAHLGGRVHDCCFELDRLHWDRALARVTLPIGCPKHLGQPGISSYRCADVAAQPSLLLEMRHVQDVAVEDTERIGFYDITEVLMATDTTVVIESSVPLSIRVAVERIALCLWDISKDRT